MFVLLFATNCCCRPVLLWAALSGMRPHIPFLEKLSRHCSLMHLPLKDAVLDMLFALALTFHGHYVNERTSEWMPCLYMTAIGSQSQLERYVSRSFGNGVFGSRAPEFTFWVCVVATVVQGRCRFEKEAAELCYWEACDIFVSNSSSSDRKLFKFHLPRDGVCWLLHAP